MVKKYFIKTFGCQMNISDSERIAAFLDKLKLKSASTIDEADLIIVNMCSIRQSAVDRVYGLLPKILSLKQKKHKITTILTGCILKNDKKKFSKSFDFILKKQLLPNWLNHLPEINKNNQMSRQRKITEEDILKSNNYLNFLPKNLISSTAFIPISLGCNNFCSYCVVPYTRGKLVCRDHQKILKEVQNFAQKGAKEIWLLGENVNEYFSPTNKQINFAKLLKMVNNISGNFWVRFTSPNPKDFSSELVEIMARSLKVTPYLNLPLQSGDAKILKLMRRSYTPEKYLKLTKKIRKSFQKYRQGLEREIALSTDIIVGFPQETKKNFQNTVQLFKEIKFDMAYISQFSPRPGTLAFYMQDNVTKKEKQRRKKVLNKILAKTAEENNKIFIGKQIEVLVKEARKDFLLAKSRHNKTVKLKGKKNLIGQFVKVKITNISAWGLTGKFIK